MARFVLGAFAGHKDQTPVAHADLVARIEMRGPREPLTIDIGAIFRGDVVKLTVIAGMDQDGTMPARDIGTLDDDIVIRQSANGVDAGLEGVNAFLIHQPVFRRGRDAVVRALNQRMGTATGLKAPGVALDRQGMKTACIEQRFPRTAEILPSRKVEVNTV